MNWHWQKRWDVKGWTFMATYGQNFCLGFGTGYSWINIRVNGVWISFGPLTFDIQPPMPKWMRDDLLPHNASAHGNALEQAPHVEAPKPKLREDEG